jgi:hypothetical protein
MEAAMIKKIRKVEAKPRRQGERAAVTTRRRHEAAFHGGAVGAVAGVG